MEIVDVLKIIAMVMLFLILILVFIYWILSRKKVDQAKVKKEIIKEGNNNIVNKSKKTYTQLPVTDFLEFDKIEDNMIIEEDGKKYLMLVECDGINYDLMSNVEKTSVEAGFLQLLNSLRYPIQLHIQTRTLNINKNIDEYNNKMQEIKKQLENKQKEHNNLIQNYGQYKEKIQTTKMELLRLQNLYDYGKDVIANIEKMNFNKNVIRQYYYVVVPCYISEITHDDMDEEEKRNLMFSELYTRAQGIVRSLSACNVKSRILNSDQIAEVLYNAFNRDEAEVNTWEKIIKSGYEELYSTAPDVLDKKIVALNEEMQKQAMIMAEQAVNEVKTQKEIAIEKAEKSFEKIVAELAKNIIKENRKYIGDEVVNKAINKIKIDEEGRVNDKRKTRKATR